MKPALAILPSLAGVSFFLVAAMALIVWSI